MTLTENKNRTKALRFSFYGSMYLLNWTVHSISYFNDHFHVFKTIYLLPIIHKIFFVCQLWITYKWIRIAEPDPMQLLRFFK